MGIVTKSPCDWGGIVERNARAQALMNATVKPAYERGDLQTALAGVNEVLNLAPDWPMYGHALQVLAIVNGEMGNFEGAAELWERFFAEVARSEYPEASMAIAHHNYGYTLRNLGRYIEAMEHSRSAVTMLRTIGSEHLVKALHDLAWSSCHAGKSEVAESALLESVQLLDDDVVSDVHYEQSVCNAFLYVVQGRTDDALALCHTLIDDDKAPAHVRSSACWVAGDTLLANGDLAEATAMARRAEMFASGDPREARLVFDARSLAVAVARASEVVK